MKVEMPTNQEKVELSAPKPITLAKFLPARDGYKYPKSRKTNVQLGFSTVARIEKYRSTNPIGLHSLINLAIATFNQEILQERFGGISQEEFASWFINHEKPPCNKNKKRVLLNVNGVSYACAIVLKNNLDFSQYVNRAIWQFLEKRS